MFFIIFERFSILNYDDKFIISRWFKMIFLDRTVQMKNKRV